MPERLASILSIVTIVGCTLHTRHESDNIVGTGGNRSNDASGPRALDPNASLVVLAENQRRPNSIAVDANHVYWTSGDHRGYVDRVNRVPLEGGTPVRLFTPMDSPTLLGTDSTGVFLLAYYTQNGIHRITPNGELVYIGPYYVNSLVGPSIGGSDEIIPDAGADTDGDELAVICEDAPRENSKRLCSLAPSKALLRPELYSFYWCREGVGPYPPGYYEIVKAPVSGGSTSILNLNQFCGGSGLLYAGKMAIDARSIYFASQGVISLPLEGGTPTILAEAAGVCSLTLDDEYVYFTDDAAGTVNKVAKTGGPVITLVFGLPSPRAIANDATSVYWLNGGYGPDDGIVMRLTPK